jgi:hypothetical protein
MATSFPTIAQLDKARTDASQFVGGQTYSLTFNVDGKQFSYVPKNIAENGGLTAGENTFLLPYFTSIDNLRDFGSKAQEVDLSSTGVNKYLQSQGLSEKGYLIPFGAVPFDSMVNPIPTETFGGELNGLKVIDGQISYGLSGGHGRRYATTTGEVHDPYIKQNDSFLAGFGSTLLNLGPLGGLLGNLILPGLGTGISIGSAVAQGASPEDLAKSYISAQIGNQVGANIGGVEGQIAGGATSGLLSGKSPEEALKGSLVSTGVGQIGSPTSIPSATSGTTATPEYIPESNIGQGTPSSTSGFYTPSINVPPTSTGQGTTGANNMADYYTNNFENYGSQNMYNNPFDALGADNAYLANTQMYDNPFDALSADNAYMATQALTPEQLAQVGMGGSTDYLSSLTPAVRASVQRALTAGGSAAQGAMNFLSRMAGGMNSNLLQGGLGTVAQLRQQQADRQAAIDSQRKIEEATRVGVAGSQFRPVGTTTRFGTSQFQTDPITGQIISAGYTAAPEISSAQNRLLGLGASYLAQTPEEVAQQYMSKQYDLLDPSRQRQLAGIRNQNFQTGRGGLSVGSTGLRPSGAQGLMGANPELEAYYNSLAQQDAQLAAQAQQAGQQNVLFGTGLFGQAGQLETMAQQPFTLSQGLAEKSSIGGYRAGDLGYRGAAASGAIGRSPAATTNPYATVLGGFADPKSLLAQGLGSYFGSSAPSNVGGTGSVFNTGYYDPMQQQF